MRSLAAATAAALAVHASRATRIGVDPSCGSDCSAAITLALLSCVGQPFCEVTLSPGVYTLNTSAYGTQIVAGGLTNALLSGPGAVLVSTDISNAFGFSGCSNFTIEGLTLDMARMPYTYGQVVASNATVATVAFNESDYPYASVLGMYPWLLGAQGVLSYDPVNMRPANKAIDIYALSDPISIKYDAATQGQLQLVTGNIPVGTWLVLRHQTYAYNAFSASGMSDFTLRNITLYTTAGMGVYTDQSTGVLLDGFRVARKAGRPMSITADGVHFSSCRGGDVTLVNCLFEGQGDDGMNIPSLYQDVESIDFGANTVTMGKDGTVQSPIGVVGDVVLFLNRSSMTAYGSSVIAAINSSHVVTFASALPLQLAMFDLTLNLNTTPRSVTLLNNTFRNNRARGTLLKATNVWVQGNVYDHNSGPAAQAIPDGCYWFEGRTVSNWTFINNTVIGVNYGPAMLPGDVYISSCAPVWQNGKPTTNGNPVTWQQLHFNVTLSDNTFITEQAEPVVNLAGVAGVTVNGNSVSYTGGTPAADFVGAGCTGSAVTSNTCNRSGGCVSTGL